MDTKIKVVARCRPLVGDEIRGRRCLTVTDDVIAVGDKRFQFEKVFDDQSTQKELYDTAVSSLVDGCFEGFNATVFAYGQTGSGKTHSIMGSTSEEDDEEAGIIPRAIKHIFDHLRSEKAIGRMASVRVSMIELYNDECKDLLHPEIPSRDIMIREDKHGRIFFTGAREEVVTTATMAMQYLEQGNLNRSTAETMMNQNSSRSHAIFTISLEMLEYSKDGSGTEGDSALIHAKLHLVDLAGSERAKKTGASGTRFKESVGINQGLLSLGKVIRALTSNPVTHVPYRESKLTRFLQDSLGGNSRTMLLACVSPSDFNLHETINTLQYAQRAKAIHNKITANVSTGVANPELQVELESTLVASLRAEIIRMQKEMLSLNNNEKEMKSKEDSSLLPTSTDENKELHKTLTKCFQVMHSCKTALQSTLNAMVEKEEDPLTKVSKQIITLLSDALQMDSSSSHHNKGNGTEHGSMLRSSITGSVTNLLRSSINQPLMSSKQQQQSSSLSMNAIDQQIMQEYEDEILNLQQQLEECQDDLKRDEEIFAEKMKELKKLKKQIKDFEIENQELKTSQMRLKQHIVKLAKIPRMMVDDLEMSTITSTPVRVGKGRRGSADGNDNRDIDGLEETADDLDISIAVALTEPDISQLLEDLEALSKEKDDIAAVHSKIAEEKIQAAETAARNQCTKVMQRTKVLKKKLQESEQQMKGMQEENSSLKAQISDLQKTMSKRIEEYEDALRGEREEKLKLLQSNSLSQSSPGKRERNTREESKWKERDEDDDLNRSLHKEKDKDNNIDNMNKSMIVKLQAQQQAQEATNARLQEEISTLQQENHTLITAMKELEDTLAKKRNDYHRDRNELQNHLNEVEGELATSLQDMEMLQKENHGLKSTIEHLQSEVESCEQELKRIRSPANKPSKSATAGSVVSKSIQAISSDYDELSHREESKLEERQQVSKADIKVTMWSTNEAEEISTWLDNRMSELIDYGLIQLDIVRLQKSLSVLETEKESINKELQYNQQQLEKIQVNVKRLTQDSNTSIPVDDASTTTITTSREEEEMKSKINQLDDKIKSMKLKASNMKMKLHQQPNNESLKSEWQDILFTISSYEEHRQEFMERLTTLTRDKELQHQQDVKLKEQQRQQQVKQAMKSNAIMVEKERKKMEETTITIQDLQEDLESLDTEMQSTRDRLRIEQEKLLKYQKQQQRFASSASSSSSSSSSTQGQDKSSFDHQIDNLLNELSDFVEKRIHPVAIVSSSNNNNKKTNNVSAIGSNTSPVSVNEAYSFSRNLSKIMVQLLVKQRVKAGSHDQTIKQLKQQLESKSQDYDNLVKTMQKVRNDGLRRQEQLKKENEEKINFLLQQMRVLEGKHTNTTLLTGGGDQYHASLLSSPSSRPQSTSSTIHSSSRPGSSHGKSGPLTSTISSVNKRNMTDLLLQHLQESTVAALTGGGNKRSNDETPRLDPSLSRNDTQDINKEVLQRWAAEKERREQLEKRNVELAKELRALRSSGTATNTNR